MMEKNKRIQQICKLQINMQSQLYSYSVSNESKKKMKAKCVGARL